MALIDALKYVYVVKEFIRTDTPRKNSRILLSDSPQDEEAYRYPGVGKVSGLKYITYERFGAYKEDMGETYLPDGTFTADGTYSVDSMRSGKVILAGVGTFEGRENFEYVALEMDKFTGTFKCGSDSLDNCTIYTRTPISKFKVKLEGNFEVVLIQ